MRHLHFFSSLGELSNFFFLILKDSAFGWITGLVALLWLLAAAGLAFSSSSSWLPLLTLAASMVSPFVVLYSLQYVALSSHSPVTRAPQAVILVSCPPFSSSEGSSFSLTGSSKILAHLAVPTVFTAFVCVKVAPHWLTVATQEPSVLARVCAAAGVFFFA